MAMEMFVRDNSANDDVKYFVRVKGKRRNFIEFDFAIGSPDLAVELVMPVDLFEEFCRRYRTIIIGRDDGESIDVERAQWRHGTLDPGDVV